MPEKIDFILSCETQVGNEAILDYLMTTYGKEILQLAYTYVKEFSLAEDLTQEIFIKCFKKLDSFKHQSSMKTWLYQIAINHCKDYIKSWYYRKVIITEKISELIASSVKQVDSEVIEKNEGYELYEAVFKLDTKYREVVYLHYYEDFSIKEISQTINVNINTVKTRLKKGRELLRDLLKEV